MRAETAGVALINGLMVASHSLRGPEHRHGRGPGPARRPQHRLRLDAGLHPRRRRLQPAGGTIDTSKADPLDVVPLWGAFEDQAALDTP
ncbi:hypothetical protein [Streptomyces sp. NPDC045251]|uniref:hypothetical protein n=1 Tax=unclassified Streptomyces TaxID=2593676 RepID=UPI00340F72EE